MVVIGISGVSSSGKSTLTDILTKNLSNNVNNLDRKLVVHKLHQDDYYYEHGEEELNWESPTLINNQQLTSDITSWIKTHSESDILLVEGFLVTAVEEIKKLLDFIIFLKIPRDICKKRRFERDEWIRKHPHYFNTVWSCYLKENKNLLKLIGEKDFDSQSSHLIQGEDHVPVLLIDGTKCIDDVVSIVMNCRELFLSNQK